MPILIHCPSCGRQLRVPDDLLEREVRCPSCAATFTASAEMDEPAPPPPPAEPAPRPRTYGSGDPPKRSEEELARPRRPRPAPPEDDFGAEALEDDEDRPRRRRRPGQMPHRGALILILGILSLVVCGLLGPVAWVMGNSDLQAMRAGRMDPEGEGTTNAGRICGIIGTILLVLGMCCGGFAFVGSMMGGPPRRRF
jgi:predicted Zn finger-like uncharacterized protein